MAGAERAAWQIIISIGRFRPGKLRLASPTPNKQVGSLASVFGKSFKTVSKRAKTALEIAERYSWLHDMGLAHLSLGRMALYAAIAERSSLDDCESEMKSAISPISAAPDYRTPSLAV